MNVALITIAYPVNPEERNIYTDLMAEFRRRGHNVSVVTSVERRMGSETTLKIENGISILRIRTGNLTKANLIEKGIATIILENQFITGIRTFLAETKFDLVLYSTPPVTFAKVIRFIKKRDRAVTYLLLKDIFPQNAVDIGMMKKNGILWRFFRHKEEQLYQISDFIGCMSKANQEYLIANNPRLRPGKTGICPNSIDPESKPVPREKEKAEIRQLYGIPGNAVLFTYGGNLGKPQGIDFLLEVIKANGNLPGSYFMIVGSGTEYGKIEQFIKEQHCQNVSLLKSLPKNEYDKLLSVSDVGLIFLDKRFTIPNFPSRLLSYMEYSLPVLASTDSNTDIKDVIAKYQFGFWCQNGDINQINHQIKMLCQDTHSRLVMGKNARDALLREYTVQKGYEIIIKQIKDGDASHV